MARKAENLEILHRQAKVESDKDSGKLRAIFSTEEPYERRSFFGGFTEVLGHKRGEVDLTRLRNDAPFLADHDNRVSSVIGRVTGARIEDRQGVADIELAPTAAAQEAKALIEAGFLGKVSVGYKVDEYTEERDGDEVMYRAVKWTPMEVSLVGVPADDGAKVVEVRSAKFNWRSVMTEEERKALEAKAKEEALAEIRAEAKAKAEAEAAAKAEANKAPDVHIVRGQVRDEVKAIMAYGSDGLFDEFDGRKLAEDVIADGGSIDDLKSRLHAAQKEKYEKAQKELEAKKAAGETQGAPSDLGFERKKFSLGRLMKHLVHPQNKVLAKDAGYELEVVYGTNADISKRNERHMNGGMTIPFAAFQREGEVQKTRADTTVANFGDFVGTDHRGDMMIGELVSDAVLVDKTNMMTGLRGNVDVPRLDSSPELKFYDESTTDADETALGDSKVTLTPHYGQFYLPLSRGITEQSDPQVTGIAERYIRIKSSLGVDRVILQGNTALVGTTQPTALAGVAADALEPSGLGSADLAIKDLASRTNGGVATYPLLLGLPGDIAGSDAAFGQGYYVMSSRFAYDLMGRQKAANYPSYLLEDGMIADLPVLQTNQLRQVKRGSSEGVERLLFGYPSQIFTGFWSGLDIFPDPYTKAKTRQIVIIGYLSMDVQIAHAESFVWRNDFTIA